MKAQFFIKSAVLAIAGTLIISSLFSAKSKSVNLTNLKPIPGISWILSENLDPFVDLNVQVKVDGEDYVNEVYSGNGLVSLPAGPHHVQVITTSYSPYQWPTGSSATLLVSGYTQGIGNQTLYNHTTSTWNDGIIDSCSFNFSGTTLGVTASTSY